MQQNSFLTEFNKVPFIKKIIFSLNGFGFALFFFGFCLLNIFLSYLSGADCLWLKISDNSFKKPHTILIGYLGELNAAPLYLLVVPVFVILACNFLCSLHEAFSGIEKAGTLKSGLQDISPLQVLGEKDRKFFKWVVLICIPFSLLLVFGLEIVSLTNTAKELEKPKPEQVVMGYVQSPHFGSWVDKLSDTNNQDFLKKQIPELKETNNPSIEPHGKVTRSVIFWLFLFSALLLQTLFVFFSAWIAIKILFYFWIVWKALPKNNVDSDKNFVYFVPNYEDPNKRYGLLELDFIYRQILWLIIFTGIGLVANLSNNYPKGTAFSQMQVKDSSWFSLLGQGWLIFAPIFLSILFGFLPLSIFRESMRKSREKVLDRLNFRTARVKQEIEGIENEENQGRIKQRELEKLQKRQDELEKLEKRKELIFSQTTYPRGDKLFVAQCIFVFVLLVIMPLFFAAKILFNPEGSPFAWVFVMTTDSIKYIKTLLELFCGCN